MHWDSSCLLLALNSHHTLWSSANPLSCKPSGITSCNVLQYRLKTLAPAALPWGMLYFWLISLEYNLLISTLNKHGWRYSSKQCNALSVTPNSTWWSTVLNMALRSKAMSEVISFLSNDHNMLLLKF